MVLCIVLCISNALLVLNTLDNKSTQTISVKNQQHIHQGKPLRLAKAKPLKGLESKAIVMNIQKQNEKVKNKKQKHNKRII